MKYGLISDIHADFARLQTAIQALKEKDISQLICLGDIVEPDRSNGCIDLIKQENAVSLLGYHDHLAVLCNTSLSEAEREYLESLPEEMQIENMFATHINPLQKARDGKGMWSNGGYINEQYHADAVFEGCSHQIILVGHTHVPKIFWKDGSQEFSESGEFELKPGERYIINPGAVGYSRDSNPSVSCAVLDTGKYLFEVLRIKEK
jgi:predicted phosphodiesterase